MPKGIPNKRYTPEFKKLVVETMHKEHLSYVEAARRFEVSQDTVVARWERIYLESPPQPEKPWNDSIFQRIMV